MIGRELAVLRLWKKPLGRPPIVASVQLLKKGVDPSLSSGSITDALKPLGYQAANKNVVLLVLFAKEFVENHSLIFGAASDRLTRACCFQSPHAIQASADADGRAAAPIADQRIQEPLLIGS